MLKAYRDSQSAIRTLSEIVRSPSGDSAWPKLEQLVRDCGFDYCGVGVIAPENDAVSITMDHATSFFDRSFCKYYEKGLHEFDPAARQIAHGASFTNAEDVLAAPPKALVEGAAKVKAHFREDGIAGHGTFRVDMPGRPFASFLGFGFSKDQASSEFIAAIREHDDVLRLAATAYTGVVLRERRPKKNGSMITAREASVLIKLANGMTPNEIAEHDGRAVVTIHRQIASARSRLGARSTTHAIALAVQLGVIRL
ncbi:MAG: helix-turn-helix transcriptional regulator [Pseudomonadota bacterium]